MSTLHELCPTWFSFNLNKAVVRQIADLTFPGERRSPAAPDRVLKEPEFFSREIVGLDQHDNLVVTYECYAPNRRLEDDVVNAQAVGMGVPDDNTTSGYQLRRVRVRQLLPSLAERWLAHSIEEGRVPRAMEQTWITGEFRVSLMTAMELGGSLWKWQDLDAVTAAFPDPDNPQPPDPQPLPIQFAKQIAWTTPEEKAALDAYFDHIHKAVHEFREKFPDNKRLALGMLPMFAMVSVVVSKTVSQWRNFILSDSQSYEAFSLKTALYRQAERLAPCLFVGCDKVLAAFATYESSVKENRS